MQDIDMRHEKLSKLIKDVNIKYERENLVIKKDIKLRRILEQVDNKCINCCKNATYINCYNTSYYCWYHALEIVKK